MVSCVYIYLVILNQSYVENSLARPDPMTKDDEQEGRDGARETDKEPEEAK